MKNWVSKSLCLNVGQHSGICSLENYCLLLFFMSSHFLQHQRVDYAVLQHINPAIWLQSHSPRFTSFQLCNCGLSFPQMPYSSLKICPCLYLEYKNGTYLLPLNILFKASLDIIWPQTNFIGGLLSVVCWRRMGQANIEWYQHFLPRSTSICERNKDNNLSWETTSPGNYPFRSWPFLNRFHNWAVKAAKSIVLMPDNFPAKNT